jgi:hypothetical protein
MARLLYILHQYSALVSIYDCMQYLSKIDALPKSLTYYMYKFMQCFPLPNLDACESDPRIEDTYQSGNNLLPGPVLGACACLVFKEE